MSGEPTEKIDPVEPPKLKCGKCGKDYPPWDLLAFGHPARSLCPDCWIKVVPKEIHEQAFKMLTPEELKKYTFKVNKDGADQGERRKLEEIEQRINKVLNNFREITVDGPEMREEITRRNLEIIGQYLFQLEGIRQGQIRRQQEEIERLKKRRLPDKTIFSGRYLDGLLDTQENALARIDKDQALRDNDVKREKLQGMIERSEVGFDLDVEEMRVMQGIFNLLSDEHDPDHPEEPIREVIRLDSWNEFFRACGCKETIVNGKAELSQGDKMRLYRATLRLRDDKKFGMIYNVISGFEERTNRPIAGAIEGRDHLFHMAIYWRDLKTGELRQIEEKLGEHGDRKYEGHRYEILVKLNPLLVDNYSGYWRAVDSGLYYEICKALGPGHHVSRYDMRFIYWLHRHHPGRGNIQINMEALASQLGMDEHLKPRKRLDRIEKILLRLYKMAQDAGYLTKYSHKAKARRGGTKEILYLNPAKILQARQRDLPGLRLPSGDPPGGGA